jgi:uncharacterized protein
MEDALKAYFKNHDGVQALFIFGSRAKKREHKQSDLDIAILFDVDAVPSLNETLELKSNLEQDLKKDVDVVILNQANPILKHQVFKYGKCLLKRNSNYLTCFQVQSLMEYDDLKQVRRPIEEKLVDHTYFS